MIWLVFREQQIFALLLSINKWENNFFFFFDKIHIQVTFSEKRP